MGALGMLGGGGGLSTSSSSSAESNASSGKIGAVSFGDKVVGGLKFSPITLGIIALAIIGGIWAWKR